MFGRRAIAALGLCFAYACAGPVDTPPEPAAAKPAILLVTLDTTRADHLGFEAGVDSEGMGTPHLDALARSGRWFRRALTPAPTTLPAHTSLLTGLYPAEHGVHENGRALPEDLPLLAERLRAGGYRTAAVVSAYPLARRFGLDRGFEVYDEPHEGKNERPADATTTRALEVLRRLAPEEGAAGPLFLWVHYFDPHEPYAPPAGFAEAHGGAYAGEIAFMDQEVGRLLEGFRQRFPGGKITALGDHGEGLGDHGERFHGHLLYQGVMRVPWIVVDGEGTGPVDGAVSTRRVYDLLLGWAGLEAPFDPAAEAGRAPVLGEAMKPFLHYGWQPQVMAVRGGWKLIRTGELEVYDLDRDPAEGNDCATDWPRDRELLAALEAYPFPPPTATGSVDPEVAERLAALGYLSGGGGRTLRSDAPSPRHRVHLLPELARASGLFEAGRYREAIPVFEALRREDPLNPTVHLRLAVAHSLLGEEEEALAGFERALEVAPDSIDARHYLAQHHLRSGRPQEAVELFEAVLLAEPGRIPSREGLARAQAALGRPAIAAELLEVVLEKRPRSAELWTLLGQQRMALVETEGAILAFERAADLEGDDFRHALELGVLELAAGRPGRARDWLDRVGPEHPAYPMALFKRAQVAVLLGEADRGECIERARAAADETTRPLLAAEPLFVEER